MMIKNIDLVSSTVNVGKRRKIVTYNKELTHNETRIIDEKFTDNLIKFYKNLDEQNINFAYLKGKDTFGAINKHIISQNKFFLKLDIKSFFESIKIDKFKEIFLSLTKDINYNDWNLIKKSLDAFIIRVSNFGIDYIPLGLCPSPLLSNIFMYKFDKFLGEIELQEVNNSLIISRYSDDILISSNNKDFNFNGLLNKIKRKLERLGLYVNNLKVKRVNLLQKYQSFNYLGISIINGTSNVYSSTPRKNVKRFKKTNHTYNNFLKNKKIINFDNSSNKNPIEGILNYNKLANKKLIKSEKNIYLDEILYSNKYTSQYTIKLNSITYLYEKVGDRLFPKIFQLEFKGRGASLQKSKFLTDEHIISILRNSGNEISNIPTISTNIPMKHPDKLFSRDLVSRNGNINCDPSFVFYDFFKVKGKPYQISKTQEKIFNPNDYISLILSSKLWIKVGINYIRLLNILAFDNEIYENSKIMEKIFNFKKREIKINFLKSLKSNELTREDIKKRLYKYKQKDLTLNEIENIKPYEKYKRKSLEQLKLLIENGNLIIRYYNFIHSNKFMIVPWIIWIEYKIY